MGIHFLISGEGSAKKFPTKMYPARGLLKYAVSLLMFVQSIATVAVAQSQPVPPKPDGYTLGQGHASAGVQMEIFIDLVSARILGYFCRGNYTPRFLLLRNFCEAITNANGYFVEICCT